MKDDVNQEIRAQTGRNSLQNLMGKQQVRPILKKKMGKIDLQVNIKVLCNFALNGGSTFCLYDTYEKWTFFAFVMLSRLRITTTKDSVLTFK